jgi:hypothetical protein
VSTPEREAVETAVARVLPPLRRVSVALVVALLAAAAAIALAIGRPGSPPGPAARDLAIVLSGVALLLMLAASRVQAMLFRRPSELSPGGASTAVGSYARSLVASWALLTLAGALGLGAAVVLRRPWTGWVFALAAALAILVRWPARTTVLRRLGVPIA